MFRHIILSIILLFGSKMSHADQYDWYLPTLATVFSFSQMKTLWQNLRHMLEDENPIMYNAAEEEVKEEDEKAYAWDPDNRSTWSDDIVDEAVISTQETIAHGEQVESCKFDFQSTRGKSLLAFSIKREIPVHITNVILSADGRFIFAASGSVEPGGNKLFIFETVGVGDCKAYPLPFRGHCTNILERDSILFVTMRRGSEGQFVIVCFDVQLGAAVNTYLMEMEDKSYSYEILDVGEKYIYIYCYHCPDPSEEIPSKRILRLDRRSGKAAEMATRPVASDIVLSGGYLIYDHWHECKAYRDRLSSIEYGHLRRPLRPSGSVRILNIETDDEREISLIPDFETSCCNTVCQIGRLGNLLGENRMANKIWICKLGNDVFAFNEYHGKIWLIDPKSSTSEVLTPDREAFVRLFFTTPKLEWLDVEEGRHLARTICIFPRNRKSSILTGPILWLLLVKDDAGDIFQQLPPELRRLMVLLAVTHSSLPDTIDFAKALRASLEQ